MASRQQESLVALDEVIAEYGDGANPWMPGPNDERFYVPDRRLLERLLEIPVRANDDQTTGRFAKAIDFWVAWELRRAGFEPNEVWPRASPPRVIPREVWMFIEALPKKLREQVEPRLTMGGRVTRLVPANAVVLGKVYEKQVDVVISSWSRGPEVLISSKSMLSSYGNNLKNRFEESYGDAKNLRGRHPMAALGFIYLLRANILKEEKQWLFAQDMLRKLREEDNVYDAVGLMLADWNDDNFEGVRILDDPVPPDLRAGPFLHTIVDSVLARTPIGLHVKVRSTRERRELPIEEGEELGAEGTPLEEEGLGEQPESNQLPLV